MTAEKRAKIAEMLYDELCYAYCDNCDNANDPDKCGVCYRKYQNWAISKDTCEHLTDKIVEILGAE